MRLAGEQHFDDLRVESRPAPGDFLQRPDQLVPVSDALLEEIPEATHPVLEQLERVVVVGELGQHDYADVGIFRADPLRGVDALDGVGWGHSDVSQYRI